MQRCTHKRKVYLYTSAASRLLGTSDKAFAGIADITQRKDR